MLPGSRPRLVESCRLSDCRLTTWRVRTLQLAGNWTRTRWNYISWFRTRSKISDILVAFWDMIYFKPEWWRHHKNVADIYTRIHIWIQLTIMADSRTFLAMANAKFKVRTPPAPPKIDRSEEHKSRHIRKRTVRCSDRCKRHLFSIMKIPTTGQHKSLRGAKYDTEHRFCQTYNEYQF